MALTRAVYTGLVLLGLLTLVPCPAAAGLRDTYDAAVAAMEAGNWSEAERLFRESLAQRPEEARRVPLKRIFRPYLPHYYLGAVLAQQSDCRGALSEWQLAEEQGVIEALGLAGELRDRQEACRQRLERLAELEAATEPKLVEATDKADELADPARDQLMQLGFEGGRGSLGQRLEAALEQIVQARTHLEDAVTTEDLELAEAAHALAEEAVADLVAALDQAERLARQMAATQAVKADRMANVKELAERVDSLLLSRSSLPQGVRARRQEIDSLLAIAVNLPASATIEQLEGLERRLSAFRGLLEQHEAPPPGTLRSGAIAYLRADYHAVLERLAEIPYRDDKTRAHCLLLRSAAAYALHLASGESDLELLERAREDVLAVRRSAPDLIPTGSAFSPRFVRFFEAVSAAVPGA